MVYREDLDEYWMFLAARANKPHSQTGCVGLCVSKDLKTWEYREPVYFPKRFNGACECPDVFRMGDWYYLVFSSYTNLFGTYYVKCPVDGTGWQIPKNHRLAARAFYAAKTAMTWSVTFAAGTPQRTRISSGSGRINSRAGTTAPGTGAAAWWFISLSSSPTAIWGLPFRRVKKRCSPPAFPTAFRRSLTAGRRTADVGPQRPLRPSRCF